MRDATLAPPSCSLRMNPRCQWVRRSTWTRMPSHQRLAPRRRPPLQAPAPMKTVRIFSDRIRDRIRLERFRSVRIRVRIFNIRYRIRIRIFKLYI